MAYRNRFGPGFLSSVLNGSLLDRAFAYWHDRLSYQSGITALAGGGQTGATQLTELLNQIDTVASAADSAMLLPSRPGSIQIVINNGANAAQIFGSGSDTINGVAAATGVSQAAGKVAVYICAKSGAWFRLLSA